MMPWALLRLLSWPTLVHAPARSFLTFAAVALGVAMIVGVSSANEAVMRSFAEASQRTAGRADLEISSDEAGVGFTLLEELAEHPDLVAHAAARVEQDSYVAGGAQPGERVLIMGLDFLGDAAFFPYKVSRGLNVIEDPLAFLNDPDAVLVTEDLAARRGLQVGSELSLRTAEGMRTFHVASLLADTSETAVFGGQVVVMFLDAAQIAFSRGHQVDRIAIQLTDREKVEAGRAKLQALVGERGVVAPPSRRASQLSRMTGSFQAAIQVQALLAILVGMFLVYNAVGVAVSQRRREVGLLRSHGAQPSTIAFVFMSEAALLGLAGSLAGLAFGKWIAQGVLSVLTVSISQLYQNIAPPAPEVEWPTAVVAVCVGVGATLLAAWFPSRRAALIQPIEAMRRDVHRGRQAALPPRRLAVGGLALLVAAALLTRAQASQVAFVGIAIFPFGAALCTPFVLEASTNLFRRSWRGLSPAILGVDNSRRDPGRSGLTAAALVMTTSVSFTLAAYASSFEASARSWIETLIPADVMITAGSPLMNQTALPFSPDWVERMQGLPSVETVIGVRSLGITVGGHRVETVGLPSDVYLSHVDDAYFERVIDGPVPIPHDALYAQGPAVLVSENLARRSGVHAGSSIMLPSPTGTHRFRVAAVIVDYQSDQGSMLMDARYLHEFWNERRIDAVELFLEPGADVDAAVEHARERVRGDDEGLYILKGTQVKAEILGMFRQTLESSRASEVISLLIAMLGIVGTMMAAVIDRTRELGVMRAMGASRGQIVWTVVSEAGWLSLCGVWIAALVAVPLTVLFLDIVGPRVTGWVIPLEFSPWGSLRIGALVIGAAMVAGALPGLRAARINITNALAYE